MYRKYIIGIFAFLTFSCTDNDEPTPFALNPENLEGTWYFKEIVKADGSIVPYINSCAALPDNVQFTITDIFVTQTLADCISVDYGQCSYYVIIPETDKMISCDEYIDGTVTEFTTTKLTIEYDQIRSFGHPQNNLVDVKAIVFEKQ